MKIEIMWRVLKTITNAWKIQSKLSFKSEKQSTTIKNYIKREKKKFKEITRSFICFSINKILLRSANFPLRG